MTRFTTLALAALVALLPLAGHAADDVDTEDQEEAPRPTHRFFASTPYLTFTNWIGEPIDMVEVHAGVQLTPVDALSLKAATWRIFESMGMQLWDPNLLKPSEWFDGRIRETGVGICYQRMLYKRLFATVEVMPMRKVFLDPRGRKVATGFRLYTSYHLGYQVRFLRERLFIEPQVHVNYWPINTKGPPGFREKVEEYDNFLLFEPNLYLGLRF